jgi:[glutamine synthetase] adenylyltransferase / [glutamine synthetase]-adenylyl-L-tyrosine phosphorylase
MARPVRKKNKPSAKDDKTLVLALTDAPRLMDRKAAQTRVAGWLTEIGRSAAGKTLKRLIADAPKLEGLLLGLADGSSFLWDLAVAEPERLLVLLNSTPDAHLAELLAKAERAVAASKDESEAMRLLRRMKAEAALLIALADIGGVWPVMQVTHAVTELADTAVRAAVRFMLREAAARGRLKPADPAKPEEGSGHIVIAMGKMGAFELNYSSDIDLIVFYDPDAAALADKDDAAAFHVRIARGLVKLLQERTADGYVFRVDLRLRPDPASTQIAVSTEAALN